MSTSHHVVGLAVLALCCFAGAQSPPKSDSRISVTDARKLATVAIQTNPAGNPDFHEKFGLEQLGNERGFLVFEGQWDNLTGGSANLGHYAVDERTGDVWDADLCREYRSPELRSLQQAIRKKLGVTNSEYHKLRRPGPMC